MCVLILPTALARHIPHSKKASARYYYKCIYIYLRKVPVILESTLGP